MSPMAIVFLSLSVGAVVYAVTIRVARDDVHPAPGLSGPAPPPPVPSVLAPPDTTARRSATTFPVGDGREVTYLPVAITPLSWRSRVTGLLGLVASIIVAASVLALLVYEVIHVLNDTIARYVE